jgi:hypothetical protein
LNYDDDDDDDDGGDSDDMNRHAQLSLSIS